MFYIPLVLIITLLSSLFVALVINPVFASVFMKLEHPDDKPETLVQKILHPFNKITHFFVDILLPKVLSYYEKVLLTALGSPRSSKQRVNKRNKLGLLSVLLFFILAAGLTNFLPITVSIIINIALGIGILFLLTNNKLRVLWGTVLMLFSITQIYGLFGHGIEFFTKTQPPRIFISVEAPSGTSLKMSDRIVNEIEKRLFVMGNRDIKEVVAVVGSSNNPFDGGSSTPNKSTLTVQFIDYDERGQSSLITTEKVRNVSIKTAGADVLIKKQRMGPPVGSPISIEINGEDYKTLGLLAEMIREKIKNVSGVVDIKDDFDVGKPEFRVEVDREKAALYSLNTGMIAGAIRTAINGSTASKYRVGEDEFDITVRLKEDQRSDLNALKTLEIIYNNKKGKTLSVPLISVATITRSKGPGAIRRKDLKRVITVSSNVKENFNENDVLNNVKEVLSAVKFPPNYTIEFTGQNKEQAKASAFLGKAFMVAILLIFLILVIQFNSLSQPLIIIECCDYIINWSFYRAYCLRYAVWNNYDRYRCNKLSLE